jgi:Tfp pilus assembly protein PilZ
MDPIQVSTDSGNGHSPLVEFAELNRKRVFGTPALTVGEMERWQELRDVLSQEFADCEEGEASDQVEKREHIRHATHIRVLIDSSEQCIARDISRGGLFISTQRPLPIESEVSLHLEIPNSEGSLQLLGRVVRIETAGQLGARSGMGIMFEGLGIDQAAKLKQLIAKLAR